MNHEILFHKENPEMPEAPPTIDEDLLYLRQIVSSRFLQANNPSKVHYINDQRRCTNLIQQVPEKELTKTPRLLKLITMLPEKYVLDEREKELCNRIMPSYIKRKLSTNDSISNQLNTNDHVQNKSSDNLNEKITQTDETEKKPESSSFQIQAGPKLIIKRSLQIQNVEPLHISPETSLKEPANIGIYNIQHETSSEKSDFYEDPIITDENQGNNKNLKETNAEKKPTFRKSVVIKMSDDSRNKVNWKENSRKNLEIVPEPNNFNGASIEGTYQSTNKDEFISQSPQEIIVSNSTKSPRQCYMKDTKPKAYIEFLSNLGKDSNYFVTDEEVKDLEEINNKIKDPGSKDEILSKKAKIISDERVNLKYKDILKGSKENPTILNLSFFQHDQNTEDSKQEIDDIHLKPPCLLYLDTVLKRNDEIIGNVIDGIDTLFKMSSQFKTHDIVMNHDSKKNTHKVEFASVSNFKPPEKNLSSLELKHGSSPEKFLKGKENYLKFNEGSDKHSDRIISGTNRFSKFISPKSDINESIISQVNVINSQSVNLSSTSVSLLSSTKNLISQKPLLLETKKSTSVSSKNPSVNNLKDLSIKFSLEEKKTPNDLSIELISENSLKIISEKIRKKENDKIEEEGKSSQILSMKNDCKKGKDIEIEKKLIESLNTEVIESDLSEALVSKFSLNSDHSSNIPNINYSASSLQVKENNFNEMEIFSHIFESLKHSPVTMKKFITCLFGETEARTENEIIGILKELNVHPIIINKFLSILQKRDKVSELSTFIKNLGIYSNLNDKNEESDTMKKKFKDCLERSKIVSLNSEDDRKLNDDNASSKRETKDKKSPQIKLVSDVTTKDEKDIYDDSVLIVTQEKTDSTKPDEMSKELFVEGIFFSKNLSSIEKGLDKINKNDIINEYNKNSSNNSVKLKSQEQNENLKIVEVKRNSPLEIKSMVDSGPSVSESSKKIDYSQNFTDSSSTSKDCKSLESHFSLKLSDSFTNKREKLSNNEKGVERNDELEIQQKIDDLLDRKKCVAQSVEESVKKEINNLTKEPNSEKNVKRKTLMRGKTFVITNSDLDINSKNSVANCSDVNSSMSDSEKGSNFSYRFPSEATESKGKNVESSTEIYSEGEVCLPSSCSYSLGEIRASQQGNFSFRKSLDANSSKTVSNSKKQHSTTSSIMSESITRSPGEFYDSSTK